MQPPRFNPATDSVEGTHLLLGARVYGTDLDLDFDFGPLLVGVKDGWMTLDGEEGDVRVTFKDYGFFVPTEGQEGKTAIVEGLAWTVMGFPEGIPAQHYGNELHLQRS